MIGYRDLSDNRTALFGIAIISILLFHLNMLIGNPSADMNLAMRAMSFVLDMGNLGVDIFIFLSGFGLYYSLSKDNRTSVFYKKRAARILPVYWIGVLIHSFVMYLITDNVDIPGFLQRLFMIEFFTKQITTLWYVPFILILYLIYPLIFRFADSVKRKTVLLIIVVVVCAGLHFVPGLEHTTYDMAKDRIPLFILGTLVGQLSSENRENRLIPIKPKGIAAAAVAYLFLLDVLILYIENIHLKPYDLLYIIYMPLCLSFLILVIWCLKAVNYKAGKAVLTKLGEVSFELYIAHMLTYDIISQYKDFNKAAVVLIFLISTAAGTIILKWSSDFASRHIFFKNHLA